MEDRINMHLNTIKWAMDDNVKHISEMKIINLVRRLEIENKQVEETNDYLIGLLASKNGDYKDLKKRMENILNEGFRINLNNSVKVKVNRRGRDVIKKRNDYLNQGFNNGADVSNKEDIEGFMIYSIWELMNIFGSYVSLGSESPFKNNEIIIYEED